MRGADQQEKQRNNNKPQKVLCYYPTVVSNICFKHLLLFTLTCENQPSHAKKNKMLNSCCYIIGIWIRDIRYKCNLLLTQVNKILKNLESKKLIKAVKSVAVSISLVYLITSLFEFTKISNTLLFLAHLSRRLRGELLVYQ